MPSITSPSPGIISPTSHRTTSPARSCEAATISIFSPRLIRLARVSVLVFRKASACAFPRASAMASAKFANRTVNHNHREIWRLKPKSGPPAKAFRIRNSVVMAAPTSTTNMTGFFARIRGFSLRKESFSARRMISRSNSGLARISFLGISEVESSETAGWPGVAGLTRVDIGSTPDWEQQHRKQFSLPHQKVLDNGAEGKRREKGERADDNHDAHEQAHKKAAVSGQRAAGRRNMLLGRQAARHRQHRNDHQETAHEHGQADREIVPGRIGVQSCESAAVVSGSAGEGIQDFTEAMRPSVIQIGNRRPQGVPISVFSERNDSADSREQQYACGHG